MRLNSDNKNLHEMLRNFSSQSMFPSSSRSQAVGDSGYRQLLAEAQKVLLSEPDGARKKALELQQKWKNLEGSATRELYQQFRKEMDRVFEGLKVLQAREEASNKERKRNLLRCAEKAALTVSGENTREIIRLQRDWKEIGRIPRESLHLNDEFRNVCNDYFTRVKNQGTSSRSSGYRNSVDTSGLSWQEKELLKLYKVRNPNQTQRTLTQSLQMSIQQRNRNRGGG